MMRMMNAKIAKKLKLVPIYLTVILLGIICVIPLYWMVRSAFMRNIEIYVMDPFIIWPRVMQWENFSMALKTVPFAQYTLNTLQIMMGNVVGIVLTSSLAGYAFGRLNWKGRNICFALLLSTLMLPGSVTLIPQFLIWKQLGYVDSFVPLILPAFMGGGAFNIFLMRQFFRGIPKELDEAAMIDGAGYMRIYSQIIMPLSTSVVIVIALFSFLGAWNDFFGPIIYLNSMSKFTLAVGLLQFRGEYSTKWNLVMAASTIVVLPCIIVYTIGQRYLIEGITLTGMKS